jgi:type IVB pilus formation R64 PilN family outer membrane protein
MGRVALSQSTGVVTVTDRPDSLERIKVFISSENKRITRQVVLNVKVLSVSLNKNDSLGLNTAALFKTLSSTVGITTSFVNPNTSGLTTTAGVVSTNSDSPWAGSQAVIDALSVQGQVTTITSPSVTTLNMKPAPILVGNQQTYLASVSTTAIQGGGTSQQALTPGTISTGFNMVLLPYLMEGREMLLQFNINMSNLLGISTFTSGTNQIQMPNIDNRIFSQSVRLLSGQTLVLSGFDQTGSTGTQQGIADPDLFLAGGRGDAARTRTELVVLITPVATD